MTGPNNKLLRWTIILFAIFFAAEVFLSFISIFILKTAFSDIDYGITFVAFLIAFTIYVVVMILLLNRCCFDLADKTMYFTAAYTAYGVFAGFGILLIYVSYNETYTWLFGMYKIFYYTSLPVSVLWSALLLHMFMLGIIAVVPLCMSYVFTENTSWTDREYRIKEIAAALRASAADEQQKRAVLASLSDDITYDEITELLKDE